MTRAAQPSPPPSSTSIGINLLALVVFTALLFYFRRRPLEPAWAVTIALGLAALPMVALDLFVLGVHRRASSSLDLSQGRATRTISRPAIKVVGVLGTLAACGLIYWLLPEYHRPLYQPYFAVLWPMAPWIALASVPYTLLVDGWQVDPRDETFAAGCFLLGRFAQVDWRRLRSHARAWLVKLFFLPLMFVWLVGTVTWQLQLPLEEICSSLPSCYQFAYEYIFMVDLLYATIGYVLTSRLIDAQIRSTDPTLLGWVVALACYPPFWTGVQQSYLDYDYDDNIFWGTLLRSRPTLHLLWGATILVMHLIYGLSSVCFGCRFSNLTYRGLLTRGPYRWSRHPAYLAKNITWWMITLPFIPQQDWSAALRNCLLLVGVNAIYFLRARTEERHLGVYPEYVAYARWIDEHGALSWLGRTLPVLRYRPPGG